jgi:GH43 family beta-xylosidase
MSNDIWAPEVHWLDNRWYIYFTATNDAPERDLHRRIYVLESVNTDIFGDYVLRGQLRPTDADEYAIDGSIFLHNGRKYFLWSGREVSAGGPQNIYIAPMANPWTLSGPRVLLSTPEYNWEKHGWWVNEGPTILSHNEAPLAGLLGFRWQHAFLRARHARTQRQGPAERQELGEVARAGLQDER